MIGYVEWTSNESGEIEHANVTRCVGVNGSYHIEFSNPELVSEGRLAINNTDSEQNTKGMYMFTDGFYKGEADVVGRLTTGGDVLTFTGTWHDPKDETGVWDLYVEFTLPSEYIFTYDERNS